MSAAAAYAQLTDKAEQQGVSLRQLVAEMRSEATEWEKEFVRLDAAFARGSIPVAHRLSAMERYDKCKTESYRLTSVLSLYAEHYGRLRTQKAAGIVAKKKKVVDLQKPVGKGDAEEDEWEANVAAAIRV